MSLEAKNEALEQVKTVATEAANEVIEAKNVEINETITKSAEDLTEKMELMQKSIDEVKTEQKAVTIKNALPVNELNAQIEEKAADIAALATNKNGSLTIELKDFNSSAGAASAPYGDERVSAIKYDPNHLNRLRNFINTGTTSQTGAIRHTFETAETDSAGSKAKGAAQTQSSVTLTDVHTPIQTLYNVLTLPKEQLNDIPMVKSYFQTRLLANLMDQEDLNILRGNPGSGAAGSLTAATAYQGLNNNGVTFANAAARAAYVGTIANDFSSTSPSNLYDVLSAVKAGLANTNYQAKVVFLNPIDATRLSLIKSTTREYVLQQTPTPDGSGVMSFFNGLRIVETVAQTAGTFTIIDPMATAYWMREGASIELGYNGNDWVSNNITYKAELRGAVTNYNQAGIVSDTFALWQAALDA